MSDLPHALTSGSRQLASPAAFGGLARVSPDSVPRRRSYPAELYLCVMSTEREFPAAPADFSIARPIYVALSGRSRGYVGPRPVMVHIRRSRRGVHTRTLACFCIMR